METVALSLHRLPVWRPADGRPLGLPKSESRCWTSLIDVANQGYRICLSIEMCAWVRA